MKFLQGFVTAIALVVLCGQAKNDGTLKLRKLEIVDAEGTVLGTWEGKRIKASEVLVSDGGSYSAITTPTGIRIVGGAYVAALTAGHGHAAVSLADLRSRELFRFAELEIRKGAGPRLLVKTIDSMTTVGATWLVDKGTGNKTVTSAASIHMFDPKGNVIWKAPQSD